MLRHTIQHKSAFVVALYSFLTLYVPPYLPTVLWSEKEFHDAAKRNDTGRMQELIKKGVDVKAKNKVSFPIDKYVHSSGDLPVSALLQKFLSADNNRSFFPSQQTL